MYRGVQTLWFRVGCIGLLAAGILAATILLDAVGITSPQTHGQAFADDDDDRGGRRGGRGRRAGDDDNERRYWKKPLKRYKKKVTKRAVKSKPAAVRSRALETRARRELVVLDVTPELTASMEARGYAVISRDVLASSQRVILRLRVPRNLSDDEAREELRRLGDLQAVDFNHFYRPDGEDGCRSRSCAAMRLIDWPIKQACNVRPTIGMVDTRVNEGHKILAGQDIEIVALERSQPHPSGSDHGTGIASILVGSATSAAPGLLLNAKLIAVDPYYRAGKSDDRANVYDLVRAIETLAARRPHAINLSLSGPANDLLDDVVATTLSAGVPVIAAVGNAGPSAPPAYPAAYDGVIAVTAVDSRLAPYRRAGRGAHIDVAAPGVDIWMASGRSGARKQTGTSFAAPFATAAVSVLMAQADAARGDGFEKMLTRHVRDIGAAGRDPIFGEGLLSLKDLCRTKLSESVRPH